MAWTQTSGAATGGGGEGTTDHAALISNLIWGTSGHTGTASRLAGFDGSGSAGFYTGSGALDLVASTQGMIPIRGAATWSGLVLGSSSYFLGSNGTDPVWRSPSQVRSDLSLVVGTNVQAWGADLDALDALGDGLPYRSGGTWSANSLGDLTLSAGSLQVTQARGLRETAGPTTLSMGAVSDGQYLKRSGNTIVGITMIFTLVVLNSDYGEDLILDEGAGIFITATTLVADGSDT